MNFIKNITTGNFSFTIVALGNGQVQLSIKPTSDDAKTFCKAKKVKKDEPLTLETADVLAKINSLETGVQALSDLLKAA